MRLTWPSREAFHVSFVPASYKLLRVRAYKATPTSYAYKLYAYKLRH